jgi:hypothetical protein
MQYEQLVSVRSGVVAVRSKGEKRGLLEYDNSKFRHPSIPYVS